MLDMQNIGKPKPIKFIFEANKVLIYSIIKKYIKTSFNSQRLVICENNLKNIASVGFLNSKQHLEAIYFYTDIWILWAWIPQNLNIYNHHINVHSSWQWWYKEWAGEKPCFMDWHFKHTLHIRTYWFMQISNSPLIFAWISSS